MSRQMQRSQIGWSAWRFDHQNFIDLLKADEANEQSESGSSLVSGLTICRYVRPDHLAAFFLCGTTKIDLSHRLDGEGFEDTSSLSYAHANNDVDGINLYTPIALPVSLMSALARFSFSPLSTTATGITHVVVGDAL